MPYKIKRARTQSVKIKQGVLVAWQGGNSNPVMTAANLVIPSAMLAPLLPPTVDNRCGVRFSSLY